MFTRLLMKWFGPSFVLKHRTTIMIFVASLFHYIPIPIPEELKTNLSTGVADLVVLIATYLITVKLDSNTIIEDLKKVERAQDPKLKATIERTIKE